MNKHPIARHLETIRPLIELCGKITAERDALKAELVIVKAQNYELRQCPKCQCEEGAEHKENCPLFLIQKDRNRYRAALEKIAEFGKALQLTGRGITFEHCRNIVSDMKKIAQRALEGK